MYMETLPQKGKKGWSLVAHSCKPNYSGEGDQEDQSLKPAGANSLPDPISKKPFRKKGW
jgi:hypothetical protein